VSLNELPKPVADGNVEVEVESVLSTCAVPKVTLPKLAVDVGAGADANPSLLVVDAGTLPNTKPVEESDLVVEVDMVPNEDSFVEVVFSVVTPMDDDVGCVPNVKPVELLSPPLVVVFRGTPKVIPTDGADPKAGTSELKPDVEALALDPASPPAPVS